MDDNLSDQLDRRTGGRITLDGGGKRVVLPYTSPTGRTHQLATSTVEVRNKLQILVLLDLDEDVAVLADDETVLDRSVRLLLAHLDSTLGKGVPSLFRGQGARLLRAC